MRDKIKLAFNPDVMTVRDLKCAAGTLRNLLQKYNQLKVQQVSDTTFAEELYMQVLQITAAYEVE